MDPQTKTAKVQRAKPLLLETRIGDPFHTIKAHKRIEAPKYNAFAF